MPPPSVRRKLFNPFRGIVYLDRGGYGHIFRIPDTPIAVKLAHRIIDTATGKEIQMTESLEMLRREQALYETLATKPLHPNIVQYFLSTDDAIFIKFEPSTLERRLSLRFASAIPEERKLRWIKEIASAASWLESFDYFHGDLRPENILLTEAEHVKVCDFGRAQKRGCRVEVATYPFYRPGKNVVAGPAHEQFAIGSCIHTILTGEVPYGQWETPAQFQAIYDALVRGEFPRTEDDGVLGHVVSSCWHAAYESMADVEADIARSVGTLHEEAAVDRPSAEEHDVYVRKCREFLDRQGREHRNGAA
ncbi:hypothetical protein VTH06DRAFT_6444 [Thermothelomyces fergusii]